MTNVFSFNQALEKGYNPSSYTYSKDEVPVGTFESKLDFKIFTKNAMAITCYFTLKLTKKKLALTVFRDQRTREYKLLKSNIDFKSSPVDELYEISIEKNGKGNIKFAKALFKSIDL